MKRVRKEQPTFEVDIAAEFREVKQSIASLADEFRQWRDVFNTQLTKLNLMMEQTLAKLADHEARISLLETKTDKHITQVETAAGTTKFWLPWLGWAFKAGVAACLLVGSAKVAKVIGIF